MVRSLSMLALAMALCFIGSFGVQHVSISGKALFDQQPEPEPEPEPSASQPQQQQQAEPEPEPEPSACSAYSIAACKAAASTLGLDEGGGGHDFEGAYGTKGCYAYVSGTYAGMAYYGQVDGGEASSASQLNAAAYPKYRPNGFACDVCVPYSKATCESVVASLGLAQGGGGYAFTGDYSNKGCYAYSSGSYSGMAFYGEVGGQDATSASGSLTSKQYRPSGHDCTGDSR